MASTWTSVLRKVFVLMLAVTVATMVSQAIYTVHGTRRVIRSSVDNSERPALTEEEAIIETERSIPNLPLARILKNRSRHAGLNASCALLPAILDLHFNNEYWQTCIFTGATAQLFGAYYDDRPAVPVVRLLGMLDRYPPNVTAHCQLWFDTGRPVVVPVATYDYLWVSMWAKFPRGVYQPYLLACPLPSQYADRVPTMVSLVEKACDKATNILKVIHDQPDNKKTFAVCVKGMHILQGDYAVRLVEWLELLRILGADKVFMYKLHVHASIERVLRHYEERGLTAVTRVVLPGSYSNHPLLQGMFLTEQRGQKRLQEVINYNDCLYRNLHSYKYVVLLDEDEVIVPTRGRSWTQLLDAVLPQASGRVADAICASNAYFFDELEEDGDELPRGLHMLRHVRRSWRISPRGYFVKCFHDVKQVLTLHNHYPLSCLGRRCSLHNMAHGEALLHHYRADCQNGVRCNDYLNHTLRDTSLWSHKDRLVAQVAAVLQRLPSQLGPQPVFAPALQ
ncbi:hypothetical protein PR048_014206 [Dryococelus australis]|uniref:Glycosyltransferase family 92 protein n=1 Tax=Dryococelus australis TaxID=614101 RepID=A0ABQ9HEB6_9NEOP|nr:hypothetical protein PR048_014206 [Dryococelus australis]